MHWAALLQVVEEEEALHSPGRLEPANSSPVGAGSQPQTRHHSLSQSGSRHSLARPATTNTKERRKEARRQKSAQLPAYGYVTH